MNQSDKTYPDVALIALCDENTEEVDMHNEEDLNNEEVDVSRNYKDSYKNRYAISHVIIGKENENIEKNLEFFKELDKKANDLKVIKLHLVCHGSYDTVPNSKKRLMSVHNPKYVDSVKAHLKALKKIMLQHKEIKLYISHDSCFGARMYYKDGKFFDIFDDIKSELDGVLDRVALATCRNKVLETRAPGRPWGLNSINDGIRRSGGVLYLVDALRRNNKQFEAPIKKLKKIVRGALAHFDRVSGNKDKNHDDFVRGAVKAYLWPLYSELSKRLNFRRYYYFDKNNKKRKFANSTKEAQKKKNEFLGLKKRNVPAKTNKETLAENIAWFYKLK